jgi:hypothetical protein
VLLPTVVIGEIIQAAEIINPMPAILVYTETTTNLHLQEHTSNYTVSRIMAQDSGSYEVSTHQNITNLPDGHYTFKAWVRSSGVQNTAAMNTQNYGGAEIRVNIPSSFNYVQINFPTFMLPMVSVPSLFI